jgi:HlyD family secretion protein
MNARMLTVCALPVTLLLTGCSGNGGGRVIHASGHIEATEIRLAAKVGGRLLQLRFEEGDSVSAGDIVARTDTTDAAHELARAEAELARADAQLRLVLAGPRPEDVERARAELARAQVELDAAERDLARLEALAAADAAAVKAEDDARARRDVAARTVKALQAVLDRLIAGPRQEEIQVASAQKAAAEAAVATAEQRVADATIVAPCSGVITVRAAEPGELLGPGALVAVLTDLSRPWLAVYVDEPSLSRLDLGDTVRVRVDGSDQDYSGTVTYVSETAEFTPKNVQTPDERAKLVFKVKVGLDNTGGVFKPGMPADAYFHRGERQGR